MLVAGEDARWHRLSTGRRFCKCIGRLIEAPWDVIEFKVVESVLQPSDFLAVCHHFVSWQLDSFMTWLTTSWESP